MNTKKALGKVAWVIFIASFVVYIPIIFTALFGANTGFMDAARWEYGGSAVWYTIFVMTLLIVLPVCLVLQILYGLLVLRRASTKRKKGVLILLASIITLIIIPVCIYDTYKLYLNKKFYKDNLPVVKSYMQKQFSPEVYESAKMVRYDRKEGYIIMNVNCDLGKSYSDSGDGTMNIYYFIEKDGTITDNFTTLFGNTFNKDFYDGLCDYLESTVNLPSNWKISIGNLHVDLSHYRPGDTAESVYPYCKYESCSITFNMSEYSDDEFLKNIDIYINEYDQYFIGTDSFFAKVNSEYIASAQVFPNSTGYTVEIRGYTDGNGVKTTENKEIIVEK